MRYQELTETEILDTQTGLVWRKRMELGTYKFDRALSKASQVAEETGQPWRVPTVEELASLLDYSRTCPASAFPDMPPYWFWSSSPYVGGANNACWVVNFSNGLVEYGTLFSPYSVRLVRGG